MRPAHPVRRFFDNHLGCYDCACDPPTLSDASLTIIDPCRASSIESNPFPNRAAMQVTMIHTATQRNQEKRYSQEATTVIHRPTMPRGFQGLN